MKEEAEILVVHLSVYLEVMFRLVIWKFSSPAHRCEMSQYVFCHKAKCMIKVTKEDDSDLSSIQLEDMFMSTLAESFGM